MKFKRTFSTVFSIISVFSAFCPLKVFSDGNGGPDYDYCAYCIETDENGQEYVSVEPYFGDPWDKEVEIYDIVIPEAFEGVPVREVSISKLYLACDPVSIKFPPTMEYCNTVWNHPTSGLIQVFGESLKKIEFSGNKNPVQFGERSFFGTGIEELKLPPIKLSTDLFYPTAPDVFAECKSLKKVEFSESEGNVSISRNMFRDCTALEEVIFPENTQSVVIESGAFSGCESLETFPFDKLGESEIGEKVFSDCGFKSVEIGCNVGVQAFENCKKLESLTTNGDISVGLSAFRNCTELENITINGNPELSKNAFFGDSKIQNINIPTLNTVNGSAFNACQNLTAINGVEVFDGNTGDFVPELRNFIINNFANADDVGFMNEYVKAQVKKIVSEIITPDMSSMQKIKTIHDWICRKVKYDSEDIYNSKNHTDCSVFVRDSVVCEGYARAFNLLLNEAGIETYYVTGVNHAWNIVNLDGHYFHIDMTWDDSDENINYNYFLKSDNQIKDDSNHSSWKLSAPSSLHDFQGSTLPECSEIMGDLNSDSDVNIADLVVMSSHLLGSQTLSDDKIALSDMNFDGYTDIFDLVSMRKNILEVKI